MEEISKWSILFKYFIYSLYFTGLQKRKKRAQNDNNKQLLVAACTDLADIYIKRGEYKLAIEEYKILAQIYQTENNKIEYAKVNRGIGEAYMGLHNFKTALEYFKIYLGVYETHTNLFDFQQYHF